VTDDHNLFATDSPRVLTRAIGNVGNIDRLLGPYDPLLERAKELDAVYLCQRLVQMERWQRAERIAGALNPLERTLAELEIAVGRQEPRKAAALAARALAIDPRSSWASYRTLATGAARAPVLDGDVNGLLREGQRLRLARDWEALERLDERLGSLDLRHPARIDAQRLRIDWRLGRGTETGSAAALRLIDLETFGGNELLARRALAGLQSRQPGVTSHSLALLASQLTAKAEPLTPLAAEWALTALDDSPEGERSRRTPALRARLVKMRDRAAPS
jgi:hypothetical protein